MRRTKVEALKRKIVRTFKDLDYPGDDKLLAKGTLDDSEIRDFYSKHWTELSDKLLAFNNSGLSFFSAMAFRFYIPAYMKFTLEYYKGTVFTCESTIYSLCPGSNQNEKFSQINKTEGAVIYEFLEFLGHHFSEEDIPQLYEAISYWKKRTQ